MGDKMERFVIILERKLMAVDDVFEVEGGIEGRPELARKLLEKELRRLLGQGQILGPRFFVVNRTEADEDDPIESTVLGAHWYTDALPIEAEV